MSGSDGRLMGDSTLGYPKFDQDRNPTEEGNCRRQVSTAAIKWKRGLRGDNAAAAAAYDDDDNGDGDGDGRMGMAGEK
ncbi:hypothetical protein PoB_003533100 [Plakobranchus ocellatus]|uniref:Uncharacterized protein n=1 Tax=Plakobranchus ocellatus TaxID=259542 RepID=A0AAV4AKJ3_9GAST|nr:hypothetical protein PoB_003533100 [Plakobranchus ocellatus]